MKIDAALASLRSHQSAILATLDTGVALVARDPGTACIPLARARWTVARQLRAYQMFKHTEIFEPVIARGDPVRSAQARAMAARCIAAGEAFQDYLKQWSSTDVLGRWEAYKPAMLDMTGQIRATLAFEREGVEALLAGSARTRRLAG